MTNEINTDKDAIINDLLQETSELKEVVRAQEDRLLHNEEATKELFKKIEEGQTAVMSRVEELLKHPQIDLSTLEKQLKMGMEAMKEEIKGQYRTDYTYKYYSLFNNSLDATTYRVVMDVTMKWLIILIVILTVFALIKFWIHYQ